VTKGLLPPPRCASTLTETDVPCDDTVSVPLPLVAVVEDDLASQKTLARVLRAGGYEAAIYASAEEFLSRPPHSSPIGLLLDMHLGGMSGLDLQRRLRNDGSTIPVIIITAFDDARSREQAERVGCVAYLRKPCEAGTILALLGRLAHDEPPSDC
jgi:FixJ family two-component response regulator